MRRLLAVLLAVLGPTLIVGAATRRLTAQPAWTPNEDVEKIDRQLAAHPFEVLTLGPSIARTDVDAVTLGASLTERPRSVARIAQPQASAPIWYSILRERVYAAGLEPELVVLVVTMPTLLTVRPPDSQMPALTQHYAEPSDVVRRKTLRSPWPDAVERALTARAAVRAPLLSWFRDSPSVLLFGPGEADGAALVAAAGEVALGVAHAPMTNRIIPVVERSNTEEDAAEGQASPEQSYLPDLAALVAVHHGRLAVVLPPSSVGRAGSFTVDPEVERAAVEVANRLEVAWLDLRQWSHADSDFTDGLHLNPEAASRFTAEMARRLVATNALGPGPPVPASAPPPGANRFRSGNAPGIGVVSPPSVAHACVATFTVAEYAGFGDESLRLLAYGLPSPLRVAEAGKALVRGLVRENECSGHFAQRGGTVTVSKSRADAGPLSVELDAESNWIWPGGSLSWRYGSSWETPAAGEVTAEIVVAVSAGEPWLEVDGERAAFSGGGDRRTARLALKAGHPPGEIQVHSPEGAWIAVRSLRVRVGDAASELVVPPAGPRFDLVTAPVYDPNPPPEVVTGELQGGPHTRRLPAPWLDTSGCSPVRVQENGVIMPAARPMGAWIAVSPADGTDPLDNGRTYRLVLDEDRLCEGENRRFPKVRTWLYPGDHLHANATLPSAGPPIVALYAKAAPTISPTPGWLRLVVHVGDNLRLDTSLPVSEVAMERALALTSPIRSEERGSVSIDATLSADAAPVLLAWFGLED